MNAFRRGLSSSTGTTTAARNAANALANRVTPSGLEGSERLAIQTEEWIAADVEDVDAVFSEPLTIDELNDARSSLESAFAQSQEEPQMAPAGHDGAAMHETDTFPPDLCDPDYQMRLLDTRPHAVIRPGVTEFLDAAVIAAQSEAVKNSVITAIFNSPDARASLERVFAANGLSVNLTQIHSQGQPALPPAAAPLQAQAVQITDITDAEEPREGKLGKPLEGLIDAITNTLGTLGGNVRSILRKFVARWKRRFDRLFNPDAVTDGDQDDDVKRSGAASVIIDTLSATATLIVILAVVRRVPGMR